MIRAVHWTMALALAAASASAHAQWTREFDLGVLHDTNLSRAQRDADRVEDSALHARAALGRAFPVGDAAELSLAGEGRLTRYTRAHGASFASLGANAGYRRSFGLGLTKPWLGADGSFAVEDAREDVRDAYRSTAALSAGKRFDARWEASAAFTYDRREQRGAEPPGRRGSDPFSVQGRSVSARASYALGERAMLIAAVALRRGDVVSSTRRNPEIFAATNATADDVAFGPDFIAYRLSGGRTRSLTAGISWELGRRSALDATLTRDDTRVSGGLDYDGVVFAVTFVHRQ